MTEPVDIVFSFDTTGSMYPCLTQVRQVVRQTVNRLFRDIENIRVGVIAHGDYCDGPNMIHMLDLTTDKGEIQKFIQGAPKTFGGDAPECYELVLHEARSLKWSAGVNKALVLIGDDVPHGPYERLNTKRLNWRNELKLLVEAGIQVHAVQALSRPWAKSFYKEVAEITGGHHLLLNQFSNVVDILMALTYHQSDQHRGTQWVTEYEEEVDREGRLTRELAAAFDTITARKDKRAAKYTRPVRELGLQLVEAGRFQTLKVPRDATIRDFVEDQDLEFAKGRGFYELTKSVKVQDHKEVVLVNKRTGEMFTGRDTRILLRLPERGTVSIGPASVPPEYTAFVQSTSVNRRLLGGTRFLYEVSDWRS